MIVKKKIEGFEKKEGRKKRKRDRLNNTCQAIEEEWSKTKNLLHGERGREREKKIPFSLQRDYRILGKIRARSSAERARRWEAVSILKRWKTEETQTGWPIGMLSGISLWLRTNCSMVSRAEKNRLFMHNTDKIWKLLKARAIVSPNNVVSLPAKYTEAHLKPTSQ